VPDTLKVSDTLSTTFMKQLYRCRLSSAIIAVILVFGLSVGETLAQDAQSKNRREGRNKPSKTQKDQRKGERAQDGLPWIQPFDAAELLLGSELLGRPTDRSVTLNVAPQQELELFVEYGAASGAYAAKTNPVAAPAGKPLEIALDGLQPNTRYYYRLRYRAPGDAEFQARDEATFHTQRAPGSAFTFAIQGDSHPERPHQNDPELYRLALSNAAANQPDFYLTIGDDFSVDTLKTVTAEAIDKIYLNQRRFLAIIGKSAPIFLVNGNHEQGAAYLLDGTPNSPAVWVQTTRNRYFPQPAPDDFYSGDAQPVEHIGLLRDYYAWTWGDALFVVIDPYWHSPVPSDNRMGGGEKIRDLWNVTLGDVQYHWLKTTLEQSQAKYKFVFAHHVLGTGRGGVEMAGLYEWGGHSHSGAWEFDAKRPNWELPIHQLMAKSGVTIFFQGHDHLFVKQERDGVVYQELPVPADPNYFAENENAYKTGDKLTNSGHLRVTVSASEVTVEYVRAYLLQDETGEQKNGNVAYSYAIQAK